MKKILLINTEYKTFGGEDANITNEIDFLKLNYKVEFLEFSNKSKLNYQKLKAFFTNNNKNSNAQLIKCIESFNPDYAYIQNTWFEANLGIFKVLKKNKVPILLKIHNFRVDCSRYFLIENHIPNTSIFCPKCSMKKSKFKIFNKYYKSSYLKSFFLILYSKKYFNILKNEKIKLVCLTEFQRNYLIGLGLDEKKLFVIPNYLSKASANEVNYNSNSDFIVYAGRIDDSKGVYQLIISWLNTLKFDLTLKIVGDGPEIDRLKSIYSSENLQFIGNLQNHKVLELIRNSRAVVTATKMFEVQPMLLCEASLNGVPSIYPSFGGMNEFFPENYDLNFEQYNYKDLELKLLLLKDVDRLKLLSDNIKKHIDIKLSQKKLSAEFENILKK